MFTSRPCSCGSGKYGEEVYDARGIYICRCCDKCRQKRLAGYRTEVLVDSNYDCDEDVDGDWPEDYGDEWASDRDMFD